MSLKCQRCGIVIDPMNGVAKLTALYLVVVCSEKPISATVEKEISLKLIAIHHSVRVHSALGDLKCAAKPLETSCELIFSDIVVIERRTLAQRGRKWGCVMNTTISLHKLQ